MREWVPPIVPLKMPMDHLYGILRIIAGQVVKPANVLVLFKLVTITLAVAKDEPDFYRKYGCEGWQILYRAKKCTVFDSKNTCLIVICLFYDSPLHRD